MTLQDLIAEIDSPRGRTEATGEAALHRLENIAAGTTVGVLVAREAYRLTKVRIDRDTLAPAADNAALRALRALGPRAVDNLLVGLQEGDPADEAAIAYALGELGAVRAEEPLYYLSQRMHRQMAGIKDKLAVIETAREKLGTLDDSLEASLLSPDDEQGNGEDRAKSGSW